MVNKSAEIHIYTDGSYTKHKTFGNPASWAAVIVKPHENPQAISGAEMNMPDSGSLEILAVIKALSSLDPSQTVILHTDHQELARLIDGYGKKTQAYKIKTKEDYIDDSNRRITRNRDLFPALFELLDQHHVIVHHIKGHGTNSTEHNMYNNMAHAEAANARENAIKELELQLKLRRAARLGNGKDLPSVEIHTDGSKKGKLGNWGAIIIHDADRENAQTLSGIPYEAIDNGSSEVTAVVESIRSLQEPCLVTIYTDRKDLRTLINEYSRGTSDERNRIRTDHKINKNNTRITRDRDRVQALFEELDHHIVTAQWERSHTPENTHNHAADRAAANGVREPTIPRVLLKDRSSIRDNDSPRQHNWETRARPFNTGSKSGRGYR